MDADIKGFFDHMKHEWIIKFLKLDVYKRQALYKAGLHAKQIEGNNKSTWILMDYEDIIVHLFSKEDRLFYDCLLYTSCLHT